MSTFSFTGNTSELSVNYYPPIYLSNNIQYEIGLINFETYNTIPNIDDKNNVIKIGPHKIQFPIGTYEITDIDQYIQKQIEDLNRKQNFNCTLLLHANANTLKTEIKCTHAIDLSMKNSLASILGFNYEVLPPNQLHISSKPIDILKVNTLKILCNITGGSYDNGNLSHILHEFFPAVPPGHKIIETPKNVIYLPLNTNVIDNITLKIVDQYNDLVNFREETITIRLHLKKLS